MSRGRGDVEVYATSDWQHVPALDGLRALAVAGVLAFHAGAGWMRGGFLGVDLFFVLSGWLITGLLLHEARASGGVDLIAFWGRRIRRLIPAVLLMLVAVIGWWSVMAPPAERLRVLNDAPSALLYASNWHEITANAGYWASFDAPSPLAHLWSLAIEEQFYLVWPLTLVLFARRRRDSLVVGVCAAGVAAAAAVSWFVSHDDLTRAYMGTDTRAASLLLGAACATPPVRRAAGWVSRRMSGAADAPLLAIGVVLAAMWMRVDGGDAPWLFRGGLLVHALLAAVGIALIAAAPRGRAARGLSWAPLRWVGRRSYSLYLWHWPVFVWFSAERTGLGGPLTTVIRFALTIALADASYRLLEDPIRTRAGWARGWTGVSAVTAAMAVAMSLVVAIPRPSSGPDRPDTAALAQGLVAPTGAGEAAAGAFAGSAPFEVDTGVLARVARRPSAPPSNTTPASPTTPGPLAPTITAVPPTTPLPLTTTVAPTTTTTIAPEPITIGSVAWYGDSIAFDAAPALKAAIEAAGLTFNTYAFAGESLTGNLFVEDGTWLDEKLPNALARRDEDVVAWQLSMWDNGAALDVKQATLTLFVELALAHHDAVVFVAAPPLENPANEVGQAELNQVAETVAAQYPGRVWFIDAGVLWGDHWVLLDESGLPLRKSDGLHLCPMGAGRFAAWLTAELAARFNGVTPADPAEWATGSWWEDRRYRTPPGACVLEG